MSCDGVVNLGANGGQVIPVIRLVLSSWATLSTMANERNHLLQLSSSLSIWCRGSLSLHVVINTDIVKLISITIVIITHPHHEQGNPLLVLVRRILLKAGTFMGSAASQVNTIVIVIILLIIQLIIKLGLACAFQFNFVIIIHKKLHRIFYKNLSTAVATYHNVLNHCPQKLTPSLNSSYYMLHRPLSTNWVVSKNVSEAQLMCQQISEAGKEPKILPPPTHPHPVLP